MGVTQHRVHKEHERVEAAQCRFEHQLRGFSTRCRQKVDGKKMTRWVQDMTWVQSHDC